jgi:hypothetical protein
MIEVEKAADGASPRSVWDPFRGSVPFRQDTATPPDPGWRAPGWLKSALGLLCLASAPVLLSGLIWRDVALFVGVPMIVVSVLGLMAIDHLGRNAGARAWRYAEIARERGWAYEATVRRARPRGRREHATGPTAGRLADPAHAPIAPLLAARPGQPIPIFIEAQYRGTTRGSIPFWLGLQEIEADATLGAAALRRDAHGNHGRRGVVLTMVAGYDLDRDTGIRALVTAQGPIAARADEATGAIAFDRLFDVVIERPAEDGASARLALLRTITPALQTTLIDLAARYRAQVLIDGRTVFFSGYDRLMSEDPAVIAGTVGVIVEAFAEAAVSFKTYAE